MRFNIDDDVEIARRRAVRSGVTLAGNANARTGLHAGGDAHVHGFRRAHAAFAATGAADGAHLAGAAAARTWHVEAHLPALLGHLPRAFALRTGLRGTDGARSMTSVASIQAGDGQLLDRPAHRIPEADAHLIFEVGAGLNLLALRSAASLKKLAEQIAKAGAARAAKIEPAEINTIAGRLFRRRGAAAFGVKAKLVVHLALLGVGENVVGFLNLLELFFGGFVAGVQVRVVLARHLPDRPWRISFGDAWRATPSEFVIVLFGCGGHTASAPISLR